MVISLKREPLKKVPLVEVGQHHAAVLGPHGLHVLA